MDKYTYTVEWLEWRKKYLGKCSEYPALGWCAKTREEAFEGIRRLIAVTGKPVRRFP